MRADHPTPCFCPGCESTGGYRGSLDGFHYYGPNVAPLVPTGDHHDEHTHPRADVAAGATIGLIAGGTLWAILGTRAIGPIALAAVVAVGLLARRDGLHRWPA